MTIRGAILEERHRALIALLDMGVVVIGRRPSAPACATSSVNGVSGAHFFEKSPGIGGGMQTFGERTAEPVTVRPGW